MKIEGKTFIITGGLGAIGGATAREIIKEGGYVSVFDILPVEKGSELVKVLHPTNAYYFNCNIADEASVKAACDGTLAAAPKGSLAGLVHCAAASKSRPWTQKMARSIEDFKFVVNVNVVGTFIMNALVSDAINSQYKDQDADLPPRVNEERGTIINIASAAATPNARVLTYGPTKTAVIGITQAASDYLGPCGIRVNTVSPSVVASAMMGDRIHYFTDLLETGAIFPRRPSAPEEVVIAIKYLIQSELANAQDIRVDGRWAITTPWTLDGPDPRTLAPALE